MGVAPTGLRHWGLIAGDGSRFDTVFPASYIPNGPDEMVIMGLRGAAQDVLFPAGAAGRRNCSPEKNMHNGEAHYD